jgi:hypothetical protein
VAFFRWHLKGESQFKEIFTGDYKPGFVYWSYQDAVRKPIDNFETPPIKVNNWGGENTFLTRQKDNSVIDCTQPNCYFDEYLFNRTLPIILLFLLDSYKFLMILREFIWGGSTYLMINSLFMRLFCHNPMI